MPSVRLSNPALPSPSVCASTDGASCNAGADREDGWIVFVRDGGDNPPFVDAGETVVRVSPAIGNDITVRGFGDITHAVT